MSNNDHFTCIASRNMLINREPHVPRRIEPNAFWIQEVDELNQGSLDLNQSLYSRSLSCRSNILGSFGGAPDPGRRRGSLFHRRLERPLIAVEEEGQHPRVWHRFARCLTAQHLAAQLDVRVAEAGCERAGHRRCNDCCSEYDL
jgi:hypothetical protein